MNAADDDLALVEALTEILSASPDIELTLPAALRRLISVFGRSGGVVVVRPASPTKEPLVLYSDLPDRWVPELKNPNSALVQLAQAQLRQNAALAAEPALGVAGVVPVHAARAVVGAVLIAGDPLPEAELNQLTYFARYMGQAVQVSRWYTAAFDQSEELSVLNKTAAELTATNDLDRILDRMVEGIRQILPVEGINVLLMHEMQDPILLKKDLRTQSNSWYFQWEVPSGAGLLTDCLYSGHAKVVHDPAQDPRYDPLVDSQPGMTPVGLMCAPLLAQGERLGVLQVINRLEVAFSHHDLELLVSLSASVSNAIYNARLINNLKERNAEVETHRIEVMRSKRTLLALFDGIPNPLYIVDANYKLVAVNKATAAVNATRQGSQDPRQPQDLVNKRCYQALYGRSEPCVDCRVAETLRRGETLHRIVTLGEDEAQTVWEVDTYPIRNDHGDTVQVIVAEHDVTHERKLQAQVAQNEKLAAIGEFAATFAHQMRNPLAAVIANAQLLERELEGEQREMATDIAEQGDMAHRVLIDVMNFSRQENYRFEPTNVNVTAREAFDTIRFGLPEGWAGEMAIDLEQILPPVRADADHLQHVLENLLSNGRDALPEAGGCLTIATRRHGDEIVISVRDNGSGIPKDKQVKIWEPFFTTKKRGKGTGLGLAYCKRVIKEHGGLIDVSSELGQGTVFTITLPVYLNGR